MNYSALTLQAENLNLVGSRAGSKGGHRGLTEPARVLGSKTERRGAIVF